MQDTSFAAKRLATVRLRIERACARGGRDPSEVALVAVSKTHPPEAVAGLARAGQDVFGESYVQEALPKMEALAGEGLIWHFIGRLQKNKVKFAVGRFGLIHSLDSLGLARILHEKTSQLGLIQPVLLQVSLAGEEQKAGCPPEDALDLARAVAGLPGLSLRGLMAMPPWNEDPEAGRSLFARARMLRTELSDALGMALPHLSMGMSHDLEQAVEEGATLVRVGTDLFGAREASTQPGQ